jgi:methylphosphotriester-DNA--protein-cysteine methyltransferase
MWFHSGMQEKTLLKQIRFGLITFAGNNKLRIYGTLECASGKRMKKQHRVFFSTEQEAISYGFRPCGHCMREAYTVWKNSLNSP